MLSKILRGFGWKDEFVRERVRDYIAHDFKKYKSAPVLFCFLSNVFPCVRGSLEYITSLAINIIISNPLSLSRTNLSSQHKTTQNF